MSGVAQTESAKQVTHQPSAAEIQLQKASIIELLFIYALPCIISLVVNSVYNIVDQIFIGQKVGYLGNAASNIIFPLICFAISVAVLFGEGGAVLSSLYLGKQQRERAEVVVNQAIIGVIIAALFMGVLMFIFAEPLLRLCGAHDELIPYAFAYGKIIILGLPISVIATALGSLIRADGSPKYAMFSLLTGAILNIGLDYIFVVIYELGVAGAAYATVISQVVNLLIALAYLPFYKNYKIRLQTWVPKLAVIKQLITYAISSAMAQLAVMLVVILNNNALVRYGAMSSYGADIPLAAFGITMKVNSILLALTMGIASGVQPVVSYNYGAGNGKRVKQAYRLALIIATALNTVGFLVFQIYPDAIIQIFGQENNAYNEFSRLCFRIFLAFIFTAGITLVSGVFMQAIGQRFKASIILMCRQIIMYIPLLFILTQIFGLFGVLYTGALADLCTCIVAIIITYHTFRNDPILAQKQPNYNEEAPA